MTRVHSKDVATRVLFCGCRPLAEPHNPLCSTLFLASATLYYLFSSLTENIIQNLSTSNKRIPGIRDEFIQNTTKSISQNLLQYINSSQDK